ncbi:MAG: uroporphyrinogen decarboxylase family protein [Planctomycetota bacterium]
MNRRERILAAIEHKPVDRVPTDIWATGEVWAKLRAHFGEGVDVVQALGVDGFAGGMPAYVGPPAPDADTDPIWGMRFQDVRYETGVYREQTVHPLADAESIDDLEAFRWPDPAWFDCSDLRERLAAAKVHQAVQIGYMAIFYLHNQLRGLEQSLVDPVLDPELTHHMLGRMADFLYAQHRRIFEAAGDCIDVTQVTDDYGSQTGPLIGLETFRTFYLPHIRRFVDLAHEFGIKVFHHDDGAMAAFLPDLVDAGIEILNPLQWTCPGMELDGLKRDWGARLCFHGAVENQRILPFGTPEEVRVEVRKCIDLLAADGTGYILAPCHNLQANTPVENILALYDEAHTYGVRS